MTEETLAAVRVEEKAIADSLPASRVLDRALHLSADLLVPAIWVALIVAIVLFSGVVSQFRYVDF